MRNLDLIHRSQLAMSTTSSSQMPIQDGQSNQLQPHVVRKKSNSSSFLYSEDNLREETILEKQVVRITPPLYVDSKRLLFEKRIRNGINSSSSYAQTTPTKTTPINKLTHSVDEHNFITRLTPLLLGVDKECQTDDIPQISNMDASREGSSNLCNVYAEVSHRNPEFEIDNACKTDVDLAVAETESDSKDRELEHVNVIITESKYGPEPSEDNNIVHVSDTLKQNGSVQDGRARDNKLMEEKGNTSKEKDEEEDSCCVNCLYITLNVCECVIL